MTKRTTGHSPYYTGYCERRTQTMTLALLGGPWDLVSTYNWAYDPTYNPPKWAYRGYPIMSRDIIPVISSY